MSSQNPSELQFPGLLNEIVTDALKDGVAPLVIVGALETVKANLTLGLIEQTRAQLDAAAQEPKIILPGTMRIVPPPLGKE